MDGTPPSIRVHCLQDKVSAAHDHMEVDPASMCSGSVRSVHSQRIMQEATNHDPALMRFLSTFVGTGTQADDVKQLLRSLQLQGTDTVSTHAFTAALVRMGYKLSDQEAEALLRYVSVEEQVCCCWSC